MERSGVIFKRLVCGDGGDILHRSFLQRMVRYKIYIDRARGYIGYIQFLMLAVILAKQFGIKLGVFGSCVLVILFFLGCLVVGYADTRLGIREEENRNSTDQVPQIKEIINILNEFKNNSSNSGSRKDPASQAHN